MNCKGQCINGGCQRVDVDNIHNGSGDGGVGGGSGRHDGGGREWWRWCDYRRGNDDGRSDGNGGINGSRAGDERRCSWWWWWCRDYYRRDDKRGGGARTMRGDTRCGDTGRGEWTMMVLVIQECLWQCWWQDDGGCGGGDTGGFEAIVPFVQSSFFG